MARASKARKREIDALNREWLVCPYCDAVWERPILKVGERAKCGRCHSVILTNKRQSGQRTIALMIASLILYVIAVSFPFMSMERSGLKNEISVIDAVHVLWVNGMPNLAVACAAFILVFPLLRMILLLHVGVSLVRNRNEMKQPDAWSLRWAQNIEPWAMAEIFMIGVVVSLVKVGKLADIYMGTAFWAFAGLIVLMTMVTLALCRDTIWGNVRWTK